jgi:hypothetical protein
MKSHGMDKFVKFLSFKNDEVKSKACRALSGLCSNNRKKILSIDAFFDAIPCKNN